MSNSNMSADLTPRVAGPESNLRRPAATSPGLGPNNVDWRMNTPNGQVQTTSTHSGGSQPPRQPAHQQAQQPRPPSSAGPSSTSCSLQPSLRGNSQGPVPGQPQVPSSHSRPSAIPPNGVPVLSSPQVQQAPFSEGAAPETQARAFRSPRSGNATLELTSEYRVLLDAIKRTSPEVVRQVIRDQWETCLLGSEYHLAFIANATFHQAGEGTLDRAIQQFGQKMIRSSKEHVIGHLRKKDFDELADDIYARVSNDFLDKGMARRLETIRARPLVNALARAGRLGYDVRDIVEEKTTDGVEHVVPSLHPRPGLAYPSQPVPSQPVPLQYGTAAPRTLPRRKDSRNHGISPGPTGPHGIVHCSRCNRPCSGLGAFQYHAAKRACEHTHKYDQIGKDICPHCGCLFGSSGGLTYHLKSKVCGGYDANTEQAVLAELHADSLKASSMGSRGPVPQMTGIPTPTQTRPSPRQSPAVAGSTPVFTPSGHPHTPQGDPYAKLTPRERLNFEAEMRKAEEKYGGLMQEAMKLPPTEREEELVKLKNSYNTKQSVTRKKYGIRLRARRTHAEVEAERSRLLAASGGRLSPMTAGHQPTQKRARTGTDGQASSAQQPGYPDGSREGSTPRKRPALAGMSGGLTGVSATAEQTDPTAYLTPSNSGGIAQVARPQAGSPRGTSDDPMQIDDSDGSDDNGSDSDDEDIPAQLPVHKT